MNINIKKEKNRKVVGIIGNLDGNTSEEVREKILAAVEAGMNLTLDMQECPYVSSAGLRTILTIGKSIKLVGGEMDIINLSDEVRDVMDMTGFSTIFKTFES